MSRRAVSVGMLLTGSWVAGCATVLGLPDEYEEGQAAIDSGSDTSITPDAASELDASVEVAVEADLDSAQHDAADSPADTADTGAHDAAEPDSEAGPLPDADAAAPIAAVAGLSVGGNTACAIVQPPQGKSVVHCWGACGDGDLGYDCASTPAGTVGSPVRVHLGVLEGAKKLASGLGSTCALMDDATVQCWGHCSGGALGRGCTSGVFAEAAPVQASVDDAGSSLSGMTRLAGFGDRYCAASFANGSSQVHCWGRSELDPESINSRAIPRKTFSGALTDLAVGGGHVCVIDSDGATLCWGLNENQQAASSFASAVVQDEVEVPTGSPMISVALGYQHSCAIRQAQGDVLCWGAWQGVPASLTVVPKQSPPYSSLAAGYWHSCALTPEGKVMCFGQNAWIWRGNAPDSTYSDPYLVRDDADAELTGMKWLGASDKFACAASEAAVYCWGDLGYDAPGPYHCSPDSGADPLCKPKAVKMAGLPL